MTKLSRIILVILLVIFLLLAALVRFTYIEWSHLSMILLMPVIVAIFSFRTISTELFKKYARGSRFFSASVFPEDKKSFSIKKTVESNLLILLSLIIITIIISLTIFIKP